MCVTFDQALRAGNPADLLRMKTTLLPLILKYSMENYR